MQNYLHCLFNSFAKLISIVISVIVYLVRIAQIFACANRQQNMINLGAELKKRHFSQVMCHLHQGVTLQIVVLFYNLLFSPLRSSVSLLILSLPVSYGGLQAQIWTTSPLYSSVVY